MFQCPIPWDYHPKQNSSNPGRVVLIPSQPAYGVVGEYKDTRRLHDGRQPNGRPHVITKDLQGRSERVACITKLEAKKDGGSYGRYKKQVVFKNVKQRKESPGNHLVN